MTEDSDEIGYKKPPSKTRFKPGRSGNPQGRPKARLSLATTYAQVAKRTVTIVDQGRRTSVSYTKATLLQLFQRALKGDLAAIKEVLRIEHLVEEGGGAFAEPFIIQMTERDMKL